MRRGQTRFLHGRCTAKNGNGSRCKFGGTVLEPLGLRCKRHAEKPIPKAIPIISNVHLCPIGPIGPDPNRTRLLCDDCSTEIFVDENMVMLKDELWLRVSEGRPKRSYCDRCIEKRLGRLIQVDDLKESNPPCNYFWIHGRKKNVSPGK